MASRSEGMPQTMWWWWRWWWRLVLVLCVGAACAGDAPRTCEPIRIDLCKDLGYNDTSMPNLVGHDLQADADLQLQTFTPLIQYRCSSQLRFFLCSVYVPMCTEKVPVPIGPCRPFCEVVKAHCHPVLQEFGFPWPPGLNCSKFPQENNHQHMCMEGPGEEAGASGAPGAAGAHHHPPYPPPPAPTSPQLWNSFPANDGGEAAPAPQQPPQHPPAAPKADPVPRNVLPAFPRVPTTLLGASSGLCSYFRQPEKHVYLNRTERCSHLCHADILFAKKDKAFAEAWVAVWASVCFVSTLFTVATFLIDAARFRYPERSIVFLSLCYNLYSVGYLVRAVAGRDAIACHLDSQHNVTLLSQDGLGNTNCAIVFLLLYYFGTATAVWWLILTLTWFLAAGLGWDHDTLQKHSSFFHLLAWCFPAAKTIAVLVMRRVDADELTGVCYVGNRNTKSLVGFVLIPQFIYLVLGSSFLLAGFLAIFRARRRARQQPSCQQSVKPPVKCADKLEVLTTRIGFFTFLYIIPAACVVGSLFYEYLSRDKWLSSFNPSGSQPNMEVFMLKIFMSLVVGITSGMWVWSGKTLQAWRKLLRRAARKKKPLPSYLQAPAPLVAPLVALPTSGRRHRSSSSHRCKHGHRRWGSETAV